MFNHKKDEGNHPPLNEGEMPGYAAEDASQQQLPPEIQQAGQTPDTMPMVPEYTSSSEGMESLPSVVIGDFDIPSNLIKQYWHLLASSNTISNLTDRDIMLHMNYYREWELDFLMCIPHRKANEPVIISKTDGKTRETDLNQLLTELRSFYRMQLTRSREGFTLDKLTTAKQIQEVGEQEKKKKKGLLF